MEKNGGKWKKKGGKKQHVKPGEKLVHISYSAVLLQVCTVVNCRFKRTANGNGLRPS